jgi:uncharacterized protein (TIRG00374 family)
VKLERISFLLGLVLFVWLLSRIGLAAVASNLQKVGWGFAAILALELVPLSLATLGWRATRRQLSRVPFRSLMAIRLAGDAINSVAPAAVLGGEIVRGKLLSRFVLPIDVFTSVSLAATAQFMAQVLFVGGGALIIPAAGLQPRLRIVGTALLLMLALFAWLLARLTGTGGRSPGIRSRLFARVDAWTGRRLTRGGLWSDLIESLRGSVRGRDGNITISTLYYLGSWLVSCLEVYLILHFFGRPVPVGTAFTIAVLMVFVEGVFFFVPARAGILEGGLYAIFSVMGLDPVQGFSLALVRRLRELAWAGIGLTLLGMFQRRREAGATISRSASAGG